MMIAVLSPTAPATDARLQPSGSRVPDASDQDPASTPDQSGATFAEAMAGVDSRREGDAQNERQAQDAELTTKQQDVAPSPRTPYARDRAARILALASSGDEAAGTPPPRYGASVDPSGATPSAPPAETGRADETPRRATHRASDPADVQALAAAAVQGGMSVQIPSTPVAAAQGETSPALSDRSQPRAPGTAPGTASDIASLPAAPRLPAEADPSGPGSPTAPTLAAGAPGIANVSAETALAVAPPATFDPAPAAPGANRLRSANKSVDVSAHAPTGAPARIAQASGQSPSSRGGAANDSEPDDASARRADLPKAAEGADASGQANASSGWTPASQTRGAENAGTPPPNSAAMTAPAAAGPQPQPVRTVSFDIEGAGSDPVRVRMRMRGDSLGLDLRADSENLRRLSTDDLRQSLERAGYAVDSIKLTASAPAASTPADGGTHTGDQEQRRYQQQQPNGAGERDAGGSFGTDGGAGQGRASAGQRDMGRRTEREGATSARTDARRSSGSPRRDVIV